MLSLSLSLSPMCHVQIHRYYRSSGHTISGAMEELRGVNMEQPRTSMYVEQSIKSSVKAGVSTAFDSPMIGVMYVTLFLMFYFESVYISKEMLLQSSYLVFVSTLLVVLMHALLVLKERNYPVCSFIPQLLL